MDAIRNAARARDKADAVLGDRMLEAQDSGETMVDIAKAAGLGRTRAYELLDAAKARRDGSEG